MLRPQKLMNSSFSQHSGTNQKALIYMVSSKLGHGEVRRFRRLIRRGLLQPGQKVVFAIAILDEKISHVFGLFQLKVHNIHILNALLYQGLCRVSRTGPARLVAIIANIDGFSFKLGSEFRQVIPCASRGGDGWNSVLIEKKGIPLSFGQYKRVIN